MEGTGGEEGTRRGRKTEGGKWTKGRKAKTTGQDKEWKKSELTEEGNVEKEQKM